MKTHSQKINWIMDIILFVGFLLSFSTGLIGVNLHPWLGIVLGALAIHHLCAHWTWVRSVPQRLAAHDPVRDHLCWLVDAGLASGFALIIGSGLVLSIGNDDLWLDFHAATALMTLGLIVLKVGLHGRWIINTFSGLRPFRTQPGRTDDRPPGEHSRV